MAKNKDIIFKVRDKSSGKYLNVSSFNSRGKCFNTAHQATNKMLKVCADKLDCEIVVFEIAEVDRVNKIDYILDMFN
jgi:hypothetical protein